MHLDVHLSTFKDLSGIDNGKKFLDILSSHGFNIEKIDEFEPVKKDFSEETFEKFWEGHTCPRGITLCGIIFKGSADAKFTGMISWGKNLHPESESVNAFNLWINVKKSYDMSKLIHLIDDIFVWSEAVYGCISEKGRCLLNIPIQNNNGARKTAYNILIGGLYGLMWVNYFGKPYINKEDFILPENAIKLAYGARLQLTEKPDDERLTDMQFIESYCNIIGDKWFWHYKEMVKEGKYYVAYMKDGFHMGKVCKPCFDRSGIVRKDH